MAGFFVGNALVSRKARYTERSKQRERLMKVHVEFDLTPAEFRQAMGLPDVEAFQQELMTHIRQQMDAGAEGYDPWSLMQPFLQQGMAQGVANFGHYQQMLMDMLRQADTQGDETAHNSKRKKS
ncbi:hypothetical protein, partial [Chromohalobacter japonicus]